MQKLSCIIGVSKRSGLRFLGVVALLAMTTGANAITIDFAAFGSNITFDGTNDSFYFSPESQNFLITGTDSGRPFGDSALGLAGAISGSFGVGEITLDGNKQSATVTSSGPTTLSIFSGADSLTADLAFSSIHTEEEFGGIKTVGAASLTNIVYEGTNLDLLDLEAMLIADAVVSFQFTPAKSLTQLMADGEITRTSFSGTIAPVPLPAAAWLFGSAVVGTILVGSRRRRSDQLIAAA